MKTLYCYISHIITDKVLKNYLDIKESIKNIDNSEFLI